MGRWWALAGLVSGCAAAAGARDTGGALARGAGPRGGKAAVYVVADSVNLGVVGASDVAVSCRDPDDVLLAGSCNVSGADNLAVFESFGTGLDDPALVATWHCGVAVTAVIPSLTAATASAACLAAP